MKRSEDLGIMQDLHDQNVKLRSSFLREDPRITGTCPRYLIRPVLRAGGLDLTPLQARQASKAFVNGDGRFNWVNFCTSVETARSTAWSPRLRLQAMKAFSELDSDGSGTLNREEVRQALRKLQSTLDSDPASMEKLIDR